MNLQEYLKLGLFYQKGREHSVMYDSNPHFKSLLHAQMVYHAVLRTMSLVDALFGFRSSCAGRRLAE